MDPPRINRSDIIKNFFQNPTKPLKTDNKISYPLSIKELNIYPEERDEDQNDGKQFDSKKEIKQTSVDSVDSVDGVDSGDGVDGDADVKFATDESDVDDSDIKFSDDKVIRPDKVFALKDDIEYTTVLPTQNVTYKNINYNIESVLSNNFSEIEQIVTNKQEAWFHICIFSIVKRKNTLPFLMYLLNKNINNQLFFPHFSSLNKIDGVKQQPI